MDAVAVALLLVGALFRAIGPRRTRSIAQIVAAVIGAAFAIGLQFAAILSFGTTPPAGRCVVHDACSGSRRTATAPSGGRPGPPSASRAALGRRPRPRHALPWPRVIRVFAPRFGQLALAAAGASQRATRRSQRPARFRRPTPAQALRRKEWTLLLRDPWLMSQTLMQLLYLLPPAFLLWRSFSAGGVAPHRWWCRS